MPNVLIADPSHPCHPLLAPSATAVGAVGDWSALPPIAPGDRVLALVDYALLGALEHKAAAFAAHVGAARVLVVAPDLPDGHALSRGLTALRAALPGARWLTHAPPIESVLEAADDVRVTRTLALSLPEARVPLMAWRDVAQAAAPLAWEAAPPTTDEARETTLVGPGALSGAELAGLLGDLLAEVLEPERFVALRLQELDVDGDGIITIEEATRYLVELGHTPASAVALARGADLDGDGTISLLEFTHGLGEQLRSALEAIPRGVTWHRTLPHLLRDRWVAAGRPFAHAHALAEHLAHTASAQPLPAALRAPTTARTVLAPWVMTLIDTFVLPGRGLLTRRSGRFGDPSPRAPELLWSPGDAQLDQPADLSHIASGGDELVTRRAASGAFEGRWTQSGATERLTHGEGDDARALELDAAGRLIGVACRGRWSGLRDTMVDLMERRTIRPWERALFRELGAIHLEHAADVVDPQEVICHCIGVRRQALVDAVDAGCSTVKAIAKATRATSICGGCTPIVEELLGSPRLAVAEVLGLEKLGGDFVRVTLAPVAAAPEPSRPGQHVVIQGRIQNRWVTRAYSLTSPGGRALPYEITVKREEMGLFSRWLCDRAGPDSLFRCSAPTGEVFLGENEVGPVYVIAGGIGITPGLAIARTVANDGSGRRVHIDWSARRPADFIFADELDALSAAHDHITWRRRVTSQDSRLGAGDLPAYTPGALAFLCGPDRFGHELAGHLREAGWPADAVRVEVFTSKVDDEGRIQESGSAVKLPSAPRAEAASQASYTPVQHTSFFLDLRETRPVLREAEAFLGQMYSERGLSAVLAARLDEVRDEIARTGTYTHTADELTYGARLAWRNSTRCVGRFFWNHLVVRDMRHLEREEDIFAAIVDHMRIATNGGDLISTMTVFRPGKPEIRLYNTQLLRYAGYRREDGSVLGDPANVELTEQALAAGWPGPRGERTRFDILPLVLRIGDNAPRWFEIPEDAILRVPLEHPAYPWFAELGLQWYALPAVSEIGLDLGGVTYRCAPFNGFYMVTEIGARNLSDVGRYDQLPIVAERLGLDTSTTASMWRDRALVELNVAVMHSFQKRRVRMLDHHNACDYFLQFERQERAAGREVYGDWSWLVPPMSGSTSPLWFRDDLRNVVYKPMYGYQPHAWRPDGPPPEHEGPIPPCPHLRARR